MVAIIGPNGAGKSSLIYSIIRADSKSIQINMLP